MLLNYFFVTGQNITLIFNTGKMANRGGREK